MDPDTFKEELDGENKELGEVAATGGKLVLRAFKCRDAPGMAELKLPGTANSGDTLVAQTANGPVTFLVPDGAEPGSRIRIPMPATAALLALEAAPVPMTMGAGTDQGEMGGKPYHICLPGLGDQYKGWHWNSALPKALDRYLSKEDWGKIVVDLNDFCKNNMDINCCGCPCNCCPPVFGRMASLPWFLKVQKYLEEQNKISAAKGVVCQIDMCEDGHAGQNSVSLYVMFMAPSPPSSDDGLAVCPGEPQCFQNRAEFDHAVESAKIQGVLAKEECKHAAEKVAVHCANAVSGRGGRGQGVQTGDWRFDPSLGGGDGGGDGGGGGGE